MALRKGSAVVAHKVHARNSFRGKIIEIVRVPKSQAGRLAETFYVVADKDGKHWCRNKRELSPLPRRVK